MYVPFLKVIIVLIEIYVPVYSHGSITVDVFDEWT